MLKRALIMVCALVGTSSMAFAQATATINGRFVDQGGAVLPGATVTVTHTATGVARTTVTNGEGLYSIPALNPLFSVCSRLLASYSGRCFETDHVEPFCSGR